MLNVEVLSDSLLSKREQIVAELESEQKLITANKTLIQIYQQKIKSKMSEIWGGGL